MGHRNREHAHLYAHFALDFCRLAGATIASGRTQKMNATNLILWSAVTILVFAGARWLFLRTKFPLLHPVLISTLVLIAVVEFFGRRYTDYAAGVHWIGWILGPGVVAMAVPIYRLRSLIFAK